MSFPIQVVPFTSTFGCIPVGFIYSIKLKVTNTSPYPEKLKISCEQPNDEPNEIKHKYMPVSLAPGMSKIVQLELHATVEKTSTYEVVILQENMETLVKTVKLFVMDPQQYKSVSNSLSAVNKRPYEDCVTIVGKITPKDETSLINKSQTFSTALIGNDEMEVLMMSTIDTALSTHGYYPFRIGALYNAPSRVCVLGPPGSAASN